MKFDLKANFVFRNYSCLHKLAQKCIACHLFSNKLTKTHTFLLDFSYSLYDVMITYAP